MLYSATYPKYTQIVGTKKADPGYKTMKNRLKSAIFYHNFVDLLTLGNYKSVALPIELLRRSRVGCGASGRNRTTDTGIFSPLLYRLSYRGKSLATRKGLEPSTSSVTGWRTNHLYYRATKWWTFRDLNPGQTGYEPVALTN